MIKNQYCQALAEMRSKSAHKLKEVGDQWRTPDLLFWGINAMFGPLVLDLFADDDNAKCPAWYTAEDNALTQDWSARLQELGGAGYGNPPYSRSQYHEKQAITGMRHIIAHTLAMREQGGRYIFLIKAATGEVWWPEEADHVAFIRGRISFDLPVWYRPEEGQPSESSAGFSAAIAVFDKSWRGERFSYITRTALEEKGRASMALAQFSASKSQQATVTSPAPVREAEKPELPLTQKGIFDVSGPEAWACVRAAFGDKEEYSFSESKFGHTWAADSVESPEFAQVSPLTIETAKQHLHESILFGVNDWLLSIQFDTEEARADMSERLRTVALESSKEYGMNSTDFITAMGSLDVASWSNIRHIRMHIRGKAKPIAEPLPESRIWPLEVGIVFDQVDGADMLDESQQNKLKANINQLWLERTATSEIITIARGLVGSMQGVTHA